MHLAKKEKIVWGQMETRFGPEQPNSIRLWSLRPHPLAQRQISTELQGFSERRMSSERMRMSQGAINDRKVD
jgi:hypothetical protein